MLYFVAFGCQRLKYYKKSWMRNIGWRLFPSKLLKEFSFIHSFKNTVEEISHKCNMWKCNRNNQEAQRECFESELVDPLKTPSEVVAIAMVPVAKSLNSFHLLSNPTKAKEDVSHVTHNYSYNF